MNAWRGLRRVLALGRYGLANNLRTPHTWAGLVILSLLTLLGTYTRWRSTGGWAIHGGFLVNGGYVAALFVLRSGIVPQREGGLQTYLRMNFASPLEHVAGAMASLLASWLVLCAAILALAWLLPGAGLGLAAWYAWGVAIGLGILLPFVLVTELASTLEVPLLVPGLLWMVLWAVAYVVLGLETTLRLSAPVQAGSFASTEPRAVRAAVSCVLGFGAILAWTALRQRR